MQFSRLCSKDQLGCQLYVAGSAGTDSRSAIGSVERLGNLAESASGNSVIGSGANENTEITSVEEVKYFDSQLQIEPFSNPVILESRKVNLVSGRSVEVSYGTGWNRCRVPAGRTLLG